jgi:nucleotide-binding universal stress UspA family protein
MLAFGGHVVPGFPGPLIGKRVLPAMTIKKILHPTDFSEFSQAALEYASALASQTGAALVVAYVDDLPQAYVEGMTAGYAGHGYAPAAESSREEVRNQLEQERPTVPGLPCEHVYLRGDAADEILKFAEQENVDLIVMGTHGRSVALQLLVGSVATAVMRRAKCPVLVVKQPSTDNGT